MRFLFFIFISTFSIFCSAEEKAIVKELVLEPFKFMQNDGTISDAKQVDLNGFSIRAMRLNPPKKDDKNNQSPMNTVSVSHPQFSRLHFSISEGKGNNSQASEISLYQRDFVSNPYLRVSDKNGDGVMDMLSYTVFDDKGLWVEFVRDYGMDGVIDFRTCAKDLSSKVLYAGKWYKVNQSDKGQWIEINGVKKDLEEVLAELAK